MFVITIIQIPSNPNNRSSFVLATQYYCSSFLRYKEFEINAIKTTWDLELNKVSIILLYLSVFYDEGNYVPFRVIEIAWPRKLSFGNDISLWLDFLR